MSDERAMRFGYLLSEIEIQCRRILDGGESDIPCAMAMMTINVREASEIAAEVSREALDKVVTEE